MNESTAVTTQGTTLAVTDPAAIAAAESARVRQQAAYQVALARPRDTDQARQRILRDCKRPRFAEAAEYSLPRGGKSIKGPTIRLIESALRSWGNVSSETQVVYEDDDVRRIKVYLTDLETNVTHSKEITIHKTVERRSPKAGDEVIRQRTNSTGQKVYIIRCTDSDLAQKEAALVSKVVRNEGRRLLPADIIEEAIEVSHETLRNRDRADPDASKRRLLDAFAEIGVMPADLAEFLGHKADTISPKELDGLRGIFQGIRDGDTTWHELMKEKAAHEKQDAAAKETKTSAEKAKDAIKAAASKKAATKAESKAKKPAEEQKAVAADDDEPGIDELIAEIASRAVQSKDDAVLSVFRDAGADEGAWRTFDDSDKAALLRQLQAQD